MRNEQTIEKPVLYDESTETPLVERRIFGGVLENNSDWGNVKYGWVRPLFDMMRGNTWFAEHVSLANEKKDYRNLPSNAKHAYDMSLAQIVFMDNFQERNLSTNLLPYITDSSIAKCITRQTWEECEHSNSYSVLIDTITDNSTTIYKKHLHDKLLQTKNGKILETFNKLSMNDKPTIPDAIEACFANLALEGIYFYSAFAFFWTLSRDGIMRGTSEMISYIARDEVTHLLLFKNIVRSMRKDYPEYFTKEYIERYTKVLTDACALEKEWGMAITNGEVAGLTPDMISVFIEYLTNDICKSLDIPLPYTKEEHPMPWVKETMKFNNIKTSMFEATPKNYNKVGLLDNF